MWGIYWTSHILQNFVLDIADLHSLFKNSSWITENCVYSSYYWSSWLMSIRIKTNVNLPWHEFFNWSCKIRASQNVVWKRLASRSHKVIHRPQSRKTSQPNAFYNFKKHRCTPSPPYAWHFARSYGAQEAWAIPTPFPLILLSRWEVWGTHTKQR